MMLIPIDLLRIDEVVEDIIESGDDLQNYYDDIDSAIKSDCFDVGIAPSDIPVDTEGYATSMRLRRLGKYYGLYRILRGYNRIGDGNEDDEYAKWQEYYQQYKEELGKLTPESIVGGSPVDTPKMTNTIKNFPVVV